MYGMFNYYGVHEHQDILTEVAPDLFLSGFKSARADLRKSKNRVLRDNVFVINLAKGTHMLSKGLYFNIDDSLLKKDIDLMTSVLPQAVAAMILALENSQVLVHCHKGIQRSATVVAAYFMATENLSVSDAVKRVQDKKPDTFWMGVNFEESLVAFRAHLDAMS